MSSKTRAWGVLLAFVSATMLLGCNKPSETNKPATSSAVKAPGPAPANTTETK